MEKILVHLNTKTDPELFFERIFPFIYDVVLGVECFFSWCCLFVISTI